VKTLIDESRRLTTAAGVFAIVGTAVSILATVHQVSELTPGQPYRFVLDGAIAAFGTFLITLGFALGGMLLERRFLLNIVFLCVAISAFPLFGYTLFHTAAARGVILKP
jgi:hypothetical protein